ncbi:MAG: hypothetical protein ACHQAR_01560 [Steroidobacterales bacterium]
MKRAIQCAASCESELAIHLRFALSQRWTQSDLIKATLQMMGYVGAPLVRGAILVAKRTFAEMVVDKSR